MATWKVRPRNDDLAYERCRKGLVGNRDSLEWVGCVRDSWSCMELPGLEIAKLQANPDQPLSDAVWTYVARHWIHFPGEVLKHEICSVDSFGEATAFAERYLVSHIGYGFTARFRNDYDFDSDTPEVLQ